MILSDKIIDVINLSKKDILEHPKGELILPKRRMIWELFGDYEKVEGVEYRCKPTVGLKRRLKLSVLCVEKVIHIWNEKFPDDKRPMNNIKLAYEYINNAISHEQIWKEVNDFIGYLDIIAYDSKNSMAAAVGSSSIAVIGLATKDEITLVYGDDNKLDENYDPYSWDASYYASIAYCGSAPWESKNIEKRREFWLWYINNAVPTAFTSYME